MPKPKFFGEGIPYLEPSALNLKGKLVETGWTRSELMSSLLYATDFAHRGVEQIHEDLRGRIETVVRRPRKVDLSLLEVKQRPS